jgi:hypothetical protein
MGNRGKKMAVLIMIAIPLRGRGYGDVANRWLYESIIRIVSIHEKD